MSSYAEVPKIFSIYADVLLTEKVIPKPDINYIASTLVKEFSRRG